jgi:hypothetical protein
MLNDHALAGGYDAFDRTSCFSYQLQITPAITARSLMPDANDPPWHSWPLVLLILLLSALALADIEPRTASLLRSLGF